MTDWNAGERNSFADELKPGTSLLHGQFTITRFLNAGGFGITYLATDRLDREVVIKECFPSSFCVRHHGSVQVRSRSHQQDYATIVRLFVKEAQRLAKLEHRNIVGVHQVFEENDTAYMSLERIRGRDLLHHVDGDGARLTPIQIKAMLLKLLDAVAYLHERAILHRDISPDNILVDEQGEPILIDFGAARDSAARATRMLSAMHTVKDGYSPYEFYVADGQQGPASDLYAVAATFYHLITGAAPPPSQARVAAVAEGRRDPYVLLSSHDSPFDRFFVSAINDALAIFPKDRLQSARGWIEQIHTEKRRAAAQAVARQDKQVEDVISRLVVETNQAVRADEEIVHQAAVAAPAAEAATAPTGTQAGTSRDGSGRPRKKRMKPPEGARLARKAPPAPARRKPGLTLGLPLTGALWRYALRRLFGSREEVVVKR